MRKQLIQSAMSLALATTLIVGTQLPGNTAIASGEQATTIAAMNVSQTSQIQLKKMFIIPSESGRMVSFTIAFANNGDQDVRFSDYGVRLQTAAGTQISMQMLGSDTSKTIIPAHGVTEYTYYANVNASTRLEDLLVKVFKWDIRSDKLQTPVGELRLPSGYSNVTPTQGTRAISVAGIPIQTSVKRMLVNKNQKDQAVTVYYELENTGNFSTTLPDLNFFIYTPDGMLYPLEVTGLDSKNPLHPRGTREVKLTADIPVAVAANAWQLLVGQSSQEGQKRILLPLGLYELQQTTQERITRGRTYQFTRQSGEATEAYAVQLNTVQRLPWEDEDILSAGLVISNPGKKALSLPDMKASFLLDDSVEVEADVVQLDQVIGLSGSGKVRYQVLGKIPYTYDYSKVKIRLQEQADNATNDLIEFDCGPLLSPFTVIKPDQSFQVQDIGRRSKVSVRNVSTYKDYTTNLYAVQLYVDNMEKRFTPVTKWVAYFKTADGTYFPAKIEEVKDKVAPQGKAMLTMWSVFPKSFALGQLDLIIGQGVTGNRILTDEGRADAYIQPVTFQLPAEGQTGSKESLTGLDLFPYSLSLSNIANVLNFVSGELQVTFDYELSKDFSVSVNQENRKLVIELVDAEGTAVVSDELALRDANSDSETGLWVGKRSSSLKKNDLQALLKLDLSKKYYLQVFDKFQTHQRLLGKKEIQLIKKK